MRRQLFQWFTVLLLVVSVWTAYANVLSDDTEVRTKARTALNEAAGCKEACKVENLRGERGMLSETIEYDVIGHGHFTIECRRPYLMVGDYSCKAAK